jgi:hypothetical protein
MPEVEALRRSLADHLLAAVVIGVDLRELLSLDSGDDGPPSAGAVPGIAPPLAVLEREETYHPEDLVAVPEGGPRLLGSADRAAARPGPRPG